MRKVPRRAEIAVATRALQRATEAVAALDAYRRRLAKDDPVLLQLLGDVELSFARRVGIIALGPLKDAGLGW